MSEITLMIEGLRRQYSLIKTTNQSSLFLHSILQNLEVQEQNNEKVKLYSTDLDLPPILSSSIQGDSKAVSTIIFLPSKYLKFNQEIKYMWSRIIQSNLYRHKNTD